MSADLVAVPRPELDRLLRVAKTALLSGVDRRAYEVVAEAARGPAAVPAPLGAAPYGFVWKGRELAEVADEQVVIAEIRRLRGVSGTGLSFRQIAEYLNKVGVRAPSGGLWRSETVRRVINREARS